jgi:L,D-transpeptidase ErfK/SrfK
MIGERVARMAADKTVEKKSPESADDREQRLYF